MRLVNSEQWAVIVSCRPSCLSCLYGGNLTDRLLLSPHHHLKHNIHDIPTERKAATFSAAPPLLLFDDKMKYDETHQSMENSNHFHRFFCGQKSDTLWIKKLVCLKVAVFVYWAWSSALIITLYNQNYWKNFVIWV